MSDNAKGHVIGEARCRYCRDLVQFPVVYTAAKAVFGLEQVARTCSEPKCIKQAVADGYEKRPDMRVTR